MSGSSITMLLLLLLLFLVGAVAGETGGEGSTIGFATVGRLSFEFDVYTLALPPNVTNNGDAEWDWEESRVTLGESVSYNAQLVEAPWGSAIVQKCLQRGVDHLHREVDDGMAELLLYVSEVEGSPQLYLDIPVANYGLRRRKRSPTAVRDSVVGNGAPKAYMNDKPSMHGDRIIFVSTEEDVGVRAQGWNAIFSLDFTTSVTKRLTPPGVTDYSPALSPSGRWVAAASNEGRGWQREIEALNIDLYIFKAEDGSERRMVVKNAGWPAWADDSTVYFHRLAEDGWWSIFKINPFSDQEAERVTPAGVHAFTPAASRCKKWIAVATQRASYRHIEIFDLQTKSFIPVTQNIHPNTHHYNPFISPSSNKIGYHRCRGLDEDATDTVTPRVEYQQSPIPGVSLYRMDGSFPSMSPDGSKVAFVDSEDDSAPLTVMNSDGSQKRAVYRSGVFGTSWDPTREDTVYSSQGGAFRAMKAPVHIVAVQNVLDPNRSSEHKFLTKRGTGNNAFPSVSPDGKYIVFRSGRTGFKNLYVMDAEGGEEKYLRRITDGPWRDTMPSWSPDNQWIAFSSNRVHPEGERSYSLYLIRPNGTDLRMLLDTGVGGLAMHPQWSPDGKRIVFASNYAGVSAEPIGYPHMYQPYGTIFVINVDGTGLTRMTHNAYEDGTPTWGHSHSLSKLSKLSSQEGNPTACSFDDVRFLNSSAVARRPPGPRLLCQRSFRPAHVTDTLLLRQAV